MTQDRDTRQRLVETAATLFADRGFKRVTVREICSAAGANVAAVNYHFGDKLGLYRAVMELAIRVMRETNVLSIEAGRGTPADEQLRAYIRVFLSRLTGQDRVSWIDRLMSREIAEPGEAMRLVMQEVIVPRMHHLSGLIGEIAGLPHDDPRVLRAVISVQSQCLMFARPMPTKLPTAWAGILHDTHATAAHIADFSLAGIHALRD